jgi:cold shock CspA family protein
MEGTVIWYSKEKEIGLIRNEDGQILVVHPSQVKSKKKMKDLKVGETLKFDFTHLDWNLKDIGLIDDK